MDTQFGVPVVVFNTKQARPLARIPLTALSDLESYDEKWLQKLVFDHPQCLPLNEIDSAYTTLLPLGREVHTNVGDIDALYITPDGRLVVLEAKLWRNPEARRKVVGQILDYAKELSRWTYDDLQREVLRVRKDSYKALFALLHEHFPDLDEAAFIDQATLNLQLGRFMLLIVGDGIREGAAAIAEFLDRFASLDFSFGLVELALFSLPDSGILVQPRVLAKTVTMKRTVFSIRNADIAATAEESEPAQDMVVELTDLQRFYEDFWKEFIGKLRLDDTAQPLPNVTRRGNVFLALPPSGSTSWITVFFDQASQTVGTFLTFTRGTFADVAYARLLADRTSIDEELGLSATWSSVEGKHAIMVQRRFDCGLRNPMNREAIMSYLADCINRFVNVFRHRMARIAEEI
jgi:hypothetical protein